ATTPSRRSAGAGGVVAAEVAGEVDDDLALGEVPAEVVAGEAVVVAAGDDRLQRQVGERLQDGEVAAGGGARAIGRDLDRHVGDDVFRARHAVVQHHSRIRPAHLLLSAQ